jgi:hypothetical protein
VSLQAKWWIFTDKTGKCTFVSSRIAVPWGVLPFGSEKGARMAGTIQLTRTQLALAFAAFGFALAAIAAGIINSTLLQMVLSQTVAVCALGASVGAAFQNSSTPARVPKLAGSLRIAFWLLIVASLGLVGIQVMDFARDGGSTVLLSTSLSGASLVLGSQASLHRHGILKQHYSNGATAAVVL